MLKNLPIGYDNFEEIIEKKLYYVDKTKVIEELINNQNKVSLFPRPRRFGKSLFISMLNYFFNVEYDSCSLFNGLYIEKSNVMDRLNKYPVIKLDLKELKKNNFDIMYSGFKEIIRELYESKSYIMDILSEGEKDIYCSFLKKNASIDEYHRSIRLLSDYLYKYYHEKVVILIDEYDVLIQEGYIKNYYDDAVSLIREVFSCA